MPFWNFFLSILVLEEARYFGIQSMVDQFENGSETLLATALTRKDVITAITSTESSKELRFQPVDFFWFPADSYFYLAFW